MFHIANKVYLDFETRLNTYDDFIIVSQSLAQTEYVPSPSGGKPLIVASSWEELLGKHFNNDLEMFWQYVTERGDVTYIYTDPRTYYSLQIQLWKSIFQNDSLKLAYDLHRFHLLNLHLRTHRHLIYDRLNLDQEFLLYNPLTKGDVEKIYDVTTVSPTLANLPREMLSFEYVLGDFFFDRDTQYKDVAIQKLEYFFWKYWVERQEKAKCDALNALFDIDQLVPNEPLNFTVDDLSNIHDKLDQNSYLSWMVDPYFNTSNVNYVRHAVDLGKQRTLIKNMCEAEGFTEQHMDIIPPDKFVQLRHLTGADKKDVLNALIDDELSRNYPHFMKSVSTVKKTNTLLISYIWALAKAKAMNKLKAFKLK